ncbi:hypothetical protein JCM8097_004506 [Rhodosporidiobolus ruineniae]
MEGQPLAPPLSDMSKLSSSTAAYPHTPPDSPQAASSAPVPVDQAKQHALAVLQADSPSHSATSTPQDSNLAHPPEVKKPVLEDSPAPAQAHTTTADAAPASQDHVSPADQPYNVDQPTFVDTAKTTTTLPPGDKAPAPAAVPAPPAVESISDADKAPLPAAEAAPVQQPDQVVVQDHAEIQSGIEAVNTAHQTGTTVVDPLTVARPPTVQTTAQFGNEIERHDAAVGQVNTAAPPTSKPIVPSAQSHLAEHPATSTDTDHVLPLGHDVHPVHQAAALEDAPDHLVNAQIEKQKADKREIMGEEPGGTIVPGLEDDKLWAMIRRFDVQIAHTLTPPTKLPPGEPDLRPTTLPAVPFNSDTLKSNLERVYATIGVWSIYAVREMMRLMSWAPEERRRTAIWCVSYFVAATFGMVIPAFVCLLIALVAYPKSRKALFPPVPPPPGQPPSATDPTNQKGDESLIAGVGHPVEHRSRTEQIEEQAWEFTNLVQRFGARVVVGGKAGGKQGNAEVGRKMHVSDDEGDDDDDLDDEEQELHQVADEQGLGVAAMKEKRENKLSDKKRLKQKQKEAKIQRDAMVGKAAKQVQDGLGAAADFFEIFANALAPPKPYPPYRAREQIAAKILAPVALVFAVTPAWLWARIAAFGFGFGFFGQPLIWRGLDLLNEKVPDWQDKLDLRNSILSKVPTNAQVVLHVVRVAERAYTPFPLPPAPPTAEHMKQAVQAGGFDEDEMSAEGYSASSSDKHSVEAGALANKSATEGEETDDESGPSMTEKAAGKTKSKIVRAFKKVAKKAAVFHGDVHVEGESAKQKVGNKIDRLLYQSRAKDEETPHSFPAKWNGTSGHLVVKHSPANPVSTLAFVPIKANWSHPTWEQPIEDIVEMKKRGVWIGRTVLGWAASINLEGMGLDIRFKPLEQRWAEKAHGGLGEGDRPHEEVVEGETYVFSHVGRRDELFRRLLGISNARWEVL